MSDDAFNPDLPRAPGAGEDTWQEVVGGFPRHLTTQLIDEGGASRARKERLAAGLVGLALALFALALPEERLLETIPMDGWRGIAAGSLGWGPLATQLAGSLHLTALALRLLVSAVCYGLCLPLALSVARQLGIGFRLALPTSLVILLSPGIWTAATTPGPGTLALLLGLAICVELWRTKPARPLLVIGLGIAAAGLDVSMAWALPAILWATRVRGKPSSRGLSVFCLSLGCVGYSAWLGLHVALERGVSAGSSLAQSYSLDASVSWPAAFSWWLAAPATLGLALFGLASLFGLQRNEAEAPPPRWLLAWCALPVVACAFAGQVPLGFPFLWLVVPALIGSLDLVARQDERVGLAWAWSAVALQSLLLVGALAFLGSSDPERDWRDNARQNLLPGDWVLTADRAHLFVLRERWGLEAELAERDVDPQVLRSRAQAVSATGARVVLDLGSHDAQPDAWAQALAGLPDLVELRMEGGSQSSTP